MCDTTTGLPVSGIAFSEVTAQFHKFAEAFADFPGSTAGEIATENWDDLGNGEYLLKFRQEEVDEYAATNTSELSVYCEASAGQMLGVGKVRVASADVFREDDYAALEEFFAALHGAGSWAAGALGTGLFPITLSTKDDNGTSAMGCRVTVAGLAPQTSNANGLFAYQWALDPGTYPYTSQNPSRYVPSTVGVVTVDATGVVTDPPGGIIVVDLAAAGAPGRGMNFGELIGQVLSCMWEWGTSNQSGHFIDRALVEQWVQQAIYRLDADLLWTQLRLQLDSVISQRRYDLIPGILRIQYVTYAAAEMHPLTTAEEIARAELNTTTGTPTHYAWYGQELALYPTPAAADDEIEVWALQTPEDLVADADYPTLPAHTHALIVDYALYQAFRHVGDIERAKACLATYEAAMQNDKSNYLNSRGVTAMRRDQRVI